MRPNGLRCASSRCLLVVIGLTLWACGGRTEYDGVTPSDGAGGSAGADGGVLGGRDGASDGPDETSSRDDVGTALADAATTISVGDFDQISDEFPKIPPSVSSSSFFWRGPNGILIGNWFVTSPTGVVRDARVDAVEPPRGASTKAIHVSGAQFSQGLDLYAELNHPSGRPVDLGRYAGMAFWSRTAAPAKLGVVLNDGTGSLVREGSWEGQVSASVATSAEWQRFEVPFADPAGVSAVARIDFIVLSGGDGVELWIDDLTFLCRGVCE